MDNSSLTRRGLLRLCGMGAAAAAIGCGDLAANKNTADKRSPFVTRPVPTIRRAGFLKPRADLRADKLAECNAPLRPD